LRELCLPRGLSADELARVEKVVYARRRVRRGEALFRPSDAFNAIYAVRSGSFKTCHTDADGREQLTGYTMAGELLGLDALGASRYRSSAIALEDSEVCVMPFRLVEELARTIPAMQRNLHEVLSREIARDRGAMLLLGSMRAEERVAAFLLQLSRRQARRGYSATEFHLRMTREEIGSLLGLKLETVSRVFSRFHDAGLIDVAQKLICIRDLPGLEKVTHSTAVH
jgi:CRP/FNR family transcriptional regulator